MRSNLGIIIGGIVSCICGCQLLVPEDPPLENPVLMADDFAWDTLDIYKEYTYIHVPRVDCTYLQTALGDTGRCNNGKRPYGDIIECKLASPAAMLEVGCLIHEDTPDLMVRISFEETASDLDLSYFGDCTVVGDGPAAGLPERYPTDIGYKACLFNGEMPNSQIVGSGQYKRPGGLYLDLSRSPQSLEELRVQAENHKFDGYTEIVLDSRLFDAQIRAEYFEKVDRVFDFYRQNFPKTEVPEVTE